MWGGGGGAEAAEIEDHAKAKLRGSWVAVRIFQQALGCCHKLCHIPGWRSEGREGLGYKI